MVASKLVGLLFEAWNDLDRAMVGVTPAEAERAEDGSSFAWTAGHLANQVDAWLNVRFQHVDPHPLIGQQRFRIGGSGEADDWPPVQTAVGEVREAARRYLVPLSEADLDLVIPYDGSFVELRERGLSLRFAVTRAVVHHYFHIGEIATKRAAMGHDVGDYPGLLEECV